MEPKKYLCSNPNQSLLGPDLYFLVVLEARSLIYIIMDLPGGYLRICILRQGAHRCRQVTNRLVNLGVGEGNFLLQCGC